MHLEIFTVLFAVFSYGKVLFGLKIFIAELHCEDKYNGPINYESLQLMLYRNFLSISDTLSFAKLDCSPC